MMRIPPEELIPGALEKYTHDLTALALQGHFAPLQRREKEVEQVIEILSYPLEVRSRHRKDNPMLIGEDSQERFAIVAEVVRRVSTGEVPEILQGRHIVALDLEKLLASTKYSIERRELFHSVLAEAWQPTNQAILFLDEFHKLAGGSPDNEFSAVVELIPALYRWHIQIIGTTNLDGGYRKYVERDAGLQRRFQEVIVSERSE